MKEDNRNKRSIRTILLWSMILLSFVMLGLLTFVFSVMQYRTLKKQATEEMQSYCVSLAQALEQRIREMDTIMLYSIASSELKEDFSDFMNSGTSFERNRSRQKLAGTMMALKGFDFTIRQFNIYDVEEGGYAVGNFNGGLINRAEDEPWHDKTRDLAGKEYIYAPTANRLASKSAGVDQNTLYLCLCRMFYNDLHVPMGFMIVESYYDEIFGDIGYEGRELDPAIAVYDNDGRQIYPEEAVFPYFSFREKGAGEIVNTYTGRKQYLCFSEDEKDGLTVAMAVDDEVFMVPVYRSLRVTAFTGILLLAVCMILSVALSKRMSDPIRKIYAFLADPEKEQFERLELGDSGVKEIDKLRDSINESIQAQESATRTMLVLKEQEMQAQMLALQSQMNPHFLYNSLSMIGEMAESGMTDQVQEMCGDITSILRYISSDSKMRIRVEEEMEQVDRYMNCMKKRFGEGLVYSYDIEDDILDCMVPKLCVQLLVENAVKAVMEHRSPWRINVEGHRDGEDWHITVSDNGPGFDPVVDKNLRRNMDEILRTGVLPSLKIEGMGILNIFIRLYLLDGIPFVFDFGNRPEGGAFVTVGGHVRTGEDGRDA